MSSNSPSSRRARKKTDRIEVPRDRDTDDKMPRDAMPAPEDVNVRDEYYADGDKPLVAGSREAKLLQKNPPPAPGELGVGTAGDAARPTKLGLHDLPVPPRQPLRES